MHDLEIYLVGGAVRDQLLDRPVGDRDWVVVGATVAEMLARGFTQVGRDFPVFLHPDTHEEYALARTERKHGQGHQGFEVFASPDVTLEQDLARRDLTVNAMAEAPDGRIIDPYGGRDDLAARRLRHVSPAFREDPLRILRVARFAAVLPDFAVARETLTMMRSMVEAGEMRTLSAERVWQELVRALEGDAPERFFAVLADCSGLGDWFEELVDRPLEFVDGSALVRFARLPLDEPAFRALCKRLKAPNEFLQTALDWLAWGEPLRAWRNTSPTKLCAALLHLRAQHDPARLQRLLAVGGVQASHAPLLDLAQGFAQVRLADDVDLQGPAYGRALREARETWVASWVESSLED